MKIVSWNMGCAPRTARYRRSHTEAWNYFLATVQPDIALIQEALLSATPPGGDLLWGGHGADSGTAIFVRHGIACDPMTLSAEGSYLAAVRHRRSSTVLVSVHVGPPKYVQHLEALVEELSRALGGLRFVVGGDMNAARLYDDVYKRRTFRPFFDAMEERGFVDCHWTRKHREVQTYWGRAKNAYQDDHLFADARTNALVADCFVLQDSRFREFSDHVPIVLDMREL